jgi:hypothetical protein
VAGKECVLAIERNQYVEGVTGQLAFGLMLTLRYMRLNALVNNKTAAETVAG